MATIGHILQLSIWVGVACLACPVTSAAEQGDISFNADVRPIFNTYCVECHGGVKQAGDLSFVYAQDAEYIVEPGEPDESYLIDRVTSDDPDEQMPPPGHGKGLSDEDIATLRRWIEQGGQWGKHWSFEQPQKSEPPQPEEAWCRQRVDHFVLDRLINANLKPSQEAPPERWLRRVSLDLIGLPPTPDQTQSFLSRVAESGEAAYVAEVDRLLKDPGFGERWASVWLDVVRYADSKGLGIDGKRTIWKYRDWVIRAFNDDLSFDQFTVKQIAGDLLSDPTMDDLLATACHRLTQTCEEGGTDDEQFRLEAVIDRVNTTMLAWQGLTFGCVQCHSHPYDPIKHEEYYRFLAYFNNTADCDLTEEEPRIRVPIDDAQAPAARAIDKQVQQLELENWQESQDVLGPLERWYPLSNQSASTNNTTRVVIEDVDGFPEYQTRGNVAKNTTVVIDGSRPADLTRVTAVRFTGLPEDIETARIDSEWGFVVSHLKLELVSPADEVEAADAEKPSETVKEIELAWVIGDEPEPLVDVQGSLNPKSNQGFGAYPRINYPRSAVFVLKTPIEVADSDRLRVSIKQNIFNLGAFPLVAHRGRVEVTDAGQLTEWLNSSPRAERMAELKKLKADRAKIRSVQIPITRERYGKFARPSFVFDRGNFLTKSDPVTPQTPEFLPGEGQGTTRLELAQWLVSPENPLTARVAVNRFWAQLFGTGLVVTQEDFGSSGESPSHPRLLDDLAARFRDEMGWSVKSLLRELVLSATYRQSSAVTPELLEDDPNNRLLSRGPRSRLPAETIRDQTLAISGLLNRTLYGEPVHPPIPDGIWLPFQGGDKWSTPDQDDPNRYRRTIYTYTKRTIQFPLLASFDAPTREFCTPRRLPSNTPLQALMTLNDATFVEASEALARKMKESAEDPDEQLAHGFQLATCRVPSADEIAQLNRLYQSSLTEEADESDRIAALKSVASVLLNLDEVLCK